MPLCKLAGILAECSRAMTDLALTRQSGSSARSCRRRHARTTTELTRQHSKRRQRLPQHPTPTARDTRATHDPLLEPPLPLLACFLTHHGTANMDSLPGSPSIRNSRISPVAASANPVLPLVRPGCRRQLALRLERERDFDVVVLWRRGHDQSGTDEQLVDQCARVVAARPGYVLSPSSLRPSSPVHSGGLSEVLDFLRKRAHTDTRTGQTGTRARRRSSSCRKTPATTRTLPPSLVRLPPSPLPHPY